MNTFKHAAIDHSRLMTYIYPRAQSLLVSYLSDEVSECQQLRTDSCRITSMELTWHDETKSSIHYLLELR